MSVSVELVRAAMEMLEAVDHGVSEDTELAVMLACGALYDALPAEGLSRKKLVDFLSHKRGVDVMGGLGRGAG